MMLVRTPAPNSTESLFGYLLRASETNGYETPGDILRLTGVTSYRITLNTIPIEGISNLLNQEIDVLQRLTYRTAQNKSSSLKILDHNLGRHSKSAPLRNKYSAFCTCCAQEDGYIDAFWDLSTSLACPKHKCKVISHCPECDRKLTWFRLGLLKCRCGAELTNIEPQRAEESLVELMKIIKAILHHKPHPNISNQTGFPLEYIKHMPLNSFLLMLNRLGVFCLQSKKEPETTDSEKITIAATEVLSNWPQGYYDFLTRLGKLYLAEKPSTVGLRTQFYQFYEAMFKRPFSIDIDFLRDEFVNFGLNVWGHAVVDKKLLRSPEKEIKKRFVSRSEFAQRFGIWKTVMDRLIADGSVVTQQIELGARKMQVIDLELSHPPVESERVITDREAAAFLGLPVRIIDHLRDRGVYKTKPRAGSARSWHQEDAEEFLQLGLSLACKTDSMPEGMESLGALMRLALRASSAKADIVAATFDGRLSVTARIGENLSGLLLDKVEVDQFILKKRVEVEEQSYSFREASSYTGIDLMTVKDAIKKGLLTSIERDGRTRITETSAKKFNSGYVTLSRQAAILKIDPRQIGNFCIKHNIPIVQLFRSSNKGNHFIMARSNVPKLTNLFIFEKNKKEANTVVNRRSKDEAALSEYLNNLRARSQVLPRSGGKPNLSKISNACGFSRDRLYDYPPLIESLNEYDEEERVRLNMDGFDPITVLSAYLNNLNENGLSLPLSRGNKPNKKLISEVCGFNRKVLYNNPEAISLLNMFRT